MREKMHKIILVMLLSLLITSCNSKNVEYAYPQMAKDESESKMGSILSGEDGDGITIFGGDDKRAEYGVGANSLLWQASLDAVNFMPIEVSDYDGGVISTDWYNIDGHKGARYKVTINIRGKQLAASSLKVVIFKQTNQGGSWQATPASPELVKEFEVKILNRARELKISSRS